MMNSLSDRLISHTGFAELRYSPSTIIIHMLLHRFYDFAKKGNSTEVNGCSRASLLQKSADN